MLKLAIVLALSATLASASPASFTCHGRTFATAEAAMQSGCCSHHQGVCGCANGRKTCCDGVVSPSCRC